MAAANKVGGGSGGGGGGGRRRGATGTFLPLFPLRSPLVIVDGESES
jgi:hypothetical protein